MDTEDNVSDQQVLGSLDDERRPLAELEAERDAFERQLDEGYKREVKIRRERALAEAE